MLDQYRPFLAVGPTSKIAAASTAPAGVQLSGDTTATAATWRQYRLQNNGTETVFYAYGSNASVAQTNAAIPTNASVGANSFPLGVGAIEVVTAPVGRYWSAITASANCSLYISPGVGL